MVRSALMIASIALCASGANAITIDFENDTSGDKPDGFMSVDSDLVSFTNTNASLGPRIDNLREQGDGFQSLQTFDSTGGLLMDFVGPVTNLSFDIGNDDPEFGPPEGQDLVAVLQGYLDGLLVATVDLLTNRNDRMDQTISLGDAVIDQALYFFADANLNPTTLGEVVDNVTFDEVSAVPLPAGGALLLGALGAFAVAGRRRRH